MKKFLTLALVFAFMLGSFAFSFSLNAESDIPAGSLIKGEGLNTIYYLGEDGKRYVFPNSKIYFSWYDDFEEIVEIPIEDLYELPLGGNVHYKPGALLVKITTDPKVYAVGPNGKLHWVKTESLAKRLYGEKWNLLVDDLADSFFGDYTVSEELDNEEVYDPEEEEDNTPDIGYNLELKTMAKIAAKTQTMAQKRCQWLSHAVNKLQKRMARWGMADDTIGSDYLEQCVADDDASDSEAAEMPAGKKVTICHQGKNTISISKSAWWAHQKQGSTIGACAGDEEPEDQENTPEEEDTTPPVLDETGIEKTVSTTSATIVWSAEEEVYGALIYKDASFTDLSEGTREESAEGLSLTHTVELTELSTSTQYFFYIELKDEADNVSTSTLNSFTTN